MPLAVATKLSGFPSLCEFIKAHVELVAGKILLNLTGFFFGEHARLSKVFVNYNAFRSAEEPVINGAHDEGTYADISSLILRESI